VQGRLSKDELDLRVSRAFAARTYADLAGLTGDLGSGRAAPRTVLHRVGPPGGKPHPPGDERLRVFLAYSLTDDAGCLLRGHLAGRFEVVTTEPMVTGGTTPRTALRRALMSTDVAVVVFPAADDLSWPATLFAAGAAGGAGGPLILVGQVAPVAARWSDSPVVRPDQVDDVISMIKEFGIRPREWLVRNATGGPGRRPGTALSTR
ncbi:MAG: DUF1707 SHOCT-like domain-containing protein, partial [Streptosporangiaceae bacterium]